MGTTGWVPQSSVKEHLKWYDAAFVYTNVNKAYMEINFANSKQAAGSAKIELAAADYKSQEISLVTPIGKADLQADGKQYRDYVVDIVVELANGDKRMVKSYIVRFVSPFYLVAKPITLHTHTTDWCNRKALFDVRETGTNEKLLELKEDGTFNISSYFTTTYPDDAAYISANPDKISWGPADKCIGPNGSTGKPSFLDNDGENSFGHNLQWYENVGQFFWQNLGTDLQVDKTTTYGVQVPFKNADIYGEALITILSKANSKAAHNLEEGTPIAEEPVSTHPGFRDVYSITYK
jgi:hypothetical protein